MDAGTLLITLLVVCAFIGILYYLVRKQLALTKELIANLTNEQKNALEKTPDEPAPDLPKSVISEAMIAKISKVTDKKVSFKILIYNTYYPNNLNAFQIGDTSLDKKTYDERELKVGDLIKVVLYPENLPKVYFE